MAQTYDMDDHVFVAIGKRKVVIPYDFELAGRDGGNFTLRPGRYITSEEIAAAKKCLYHNRDVVTLRVERV